MHSPLQISLRAAAALVGALAWHGVAASSDIAYQVQQGDSLWTIAERYLQRPAQAFALARVNRLANPDRVPAGMRLQIPFDWLRQETTGVRIAAHRGEVGLRLGQGAERAPEPREWVQPPATVRTGADGSARLEFADGSRMLLLQASEVGIRQSAATVLGQQRLVTLELLRGGLENEVQPAGAGGRFQIRTPAATAAVRGTDFRAHLRGEALLTEVLHGTVDVANAHGDVLLGAAQGTSALPGSAPAAAVALLPAPDLTALPTRIERLPAALPLPALVGAQGYRSQVSDDPAFQLTLSDVTDAAARVPLDDLPDGHYVLRVRGVDAQGLQGRSAEHRLQIHARPEPPILIEPADGQTTSEAQPVFRWAGSRPSGGYRLQVFADGRDAPSLDIAAPQQRAQADVTLPPGRYRWRVAAIDAATGPGPWSDALPFRRQLDAPADGLDRSAQALQWRAVPGASGYRVQIASSADFSAPVLDQQTEGAHLSMPTLAPGIYRVRLQTLDAGGHASAWGTVQEFAIEPPAPTAPSRWPALLLLLPLVLL